MSDTQKQTQTYLNDIVNSDIQYRTTNNETIEETNTRIRTSICDNFNKILLTNEQKDLFRVWEKEVNTLPTTATRKELYSVAPENCLHIIGL